MDMQKEVSNQIENIKNHTGKRLHTCLDRLAQAVYSLNIGYDADMKVYWRANNYSGHSLAVMNCSEGDLEALREHAKYASSAELKALGRPRFETLGLNTVCYFEKVRK